MVESARELCDSVRVGGGDDDGVKSVLLSRRRK